MARVGTVEGPSFVQGQDVGASPRPPWIHEHPEEIELHMNVIKAHRLQTSHITGEIENNTDVPVKEVEATAWLCDDHGQDVDPQVGE